MSPPSKSIDLVLSSGFLAFGRHTGFLAAVEDLGLDVTGLCGTSSGALVGSLWAAGRPAQDILERLTTHSPLAWLRLSLRPWRGPFRLDRMIQELHQWLPPTFEDLDHPFAVGVVDAYTGVHQLITSGPLPEAVAASCALPIFSPVEVRGRPFRDGGIVDRTGVRPYMRFRPGKPLILHLVQSSHSSGEEDTGDARVVHSERSGAKLWGLGDVRGRFEITRESVRRALEPDAAEPPPG